MALHTRVFTWCILAALFHSSFCNDPPFWDTDSYSLFVSEDTPIDASIGKLVCNDPEGDQVVYRVDSSQDFFVNSFTGEILLQTELNFETTSKIIDVTFECTDVVDGRARQPWVSARTDFTVLDANDNSPQFTTTNKEGYVYSIYENATVGTDLVPSLTIKDLDTGDNALLRTLYFICDSTNQTVVDALEETSKRTCSKFGIRWDQILTEAGLYRATIYTEAPLDYETWPVYSSKLVAVDGDGQAVKSLTSTINVQFNIQDSQDRPPEFTNPGESASVSEDVAVGTTLSFGVSARDGDTGPGAARPVKITLLKDLSDIADLFTLTEAAPDDTALETGVYTSRLVVKNILDREEIADSYELVVKVVELDPTVNPPQETTASATATYSVFVTDINDNAPVFQPDVYYINVTEMATRDATDDIPYQPTTLAGLHIKCIDKDEPSNAEYEVRIVRQTFAEAYSISPARTTFTGQGSMFLQVDDPKYLDFDVESYRNQVVELEAKEINTAERFSSSCTVYISLRDVNDNSPRFQRSSYTASVSESTATFPYKLLDIIAVDNDFGQNGNIVYRLEEGTPDLFAINPLTGELSLLKPVDYEKTQQYVFIVYASDQATIPRSDQAQVTVNVLNFNDQGPVFRQSSYQTSARETSKSFLNPITVRAVDSEDPDATITYRIISGQSPNNAFAINKNTGELSLKEFLDYQQTPVNAQRERLGYFTLRVEASDNGSPPETNNVTVTVSVIDENNHSPVVNPTLYKKTISELEEPGTIIAEIQAEDKDAGNFGKISYRLGPGGNSGNFKVDIDTGVVTVASGNSFDYDKTQAYTILIHATDGGAPQRTATATVQVTLTNANNKQPRFSEYLYRTTVPDVTPIGQTVLTTKAQDDDYDTIQEADQYLRYSIDFDSIQAADGDGNALKINNRDNYDFKNAFAIRDRGEIYVNGLLDKNIAQEINFKVVVEDTRAENGLQTADTLVTIIIEGEPDNSLIFDQIAVAFVNEDARPGFSAATLIARDPANNQGPIKNFRKLPGSSRFFDVQEDNVVLSSSLDYEKDPQSHIIYVLATSDDGTRSATATVTVSLIDANDVTPRFTLDNYFAEISENAVYPASVQVIEALDDDSASFGPIKYRITGGLDSGDFDIFHQGSRAEVIVAFDKKLDYNRRPLYQLTIEAVDNQLQEFSSTRLTGSASLTIRVIDENNNVPYFKDTFRSYVVPETASIDQNIAIIRAFDDDSGANGDITYSLEAGSQENPTAGLSLFDISSSQGTIYVIGNLLGRGGVRYSLNVRARDRGEQPNSNFLPIVITVLSTEDDDGFPKWNYPAVNFVVEAPEETPGFSLTELKLDASARTGVNITYALSPFSEGYSSFSIDELTGLITIEDSLDREMKAEYEIHVYAQDTNDTTRLRTGRSFIVRLVDKNDNDATFTNPKGYTTCGSTSAGDFIRVPVKENTPANTTVYRVQACDPDGPGYNGIRYEVYKDNDYCTAMQSSALRLEEDGRLITNQILDYEQQKEYLMCVKAKSRVPVAKSTRKKRDFDPERIDPLPDVAYVWIQIVDLNDHGPEFPNPAAVAVVPSSPGSGPIHQLDAVDKDGQGYNITQYMIKNSVFYPYGGDSAVVVKEAFELRGNKGAIFPKKPSYQDYVGGRFVLRVLALDAQDNTKTDTQQITIYVHEKGESVKLVLDENPAVGFTYASDLINALDRVDSRYVLQYISASENRMKDGVDLNKTDVCFLAVDTNSHEVLNIRQVISLLNKDDYQVVLDDKKYRVEDRGKCYPSTSSEDSVKWKDLWWVLVAVAIFLFVCCLICIILIAVLYDNYKSYMETRQTMLVVQ